MYEDKRTFAKPSALWKLLGLQAPANPLREADEILEQQQIETLQKAIKTTPTQPIPIAKPKENVDTAPAILQFEPEAKPVIEDTYELDDSQSRLRHINVAQRMRAQRDDMFKKIISDKQELMGVPHFDIRTKDGILRQNETVEHKRSKSELKRKKRKLRKPDYHTKSFSEDTVMTLPDIQGERRSSTTDDIPIMKNHQLTISTATSNGFSLPTLHSNRTPVDNRTRRSDYSPLIPIQSSRNSVIGDQTSMRRRRISDVEEPVITRSHTVLERRAPDWEVGDVSDVEEEETNTYNKSTNSSVPSSNESTRRRKNSNLYKAAPDLKFNADVNRYRTPVDETPEQARERSNSDESHLSFGISSISTPKRKSSFQSTSSREEANEYEYQGHIQDAKPSSRSSQDMEATTSASEDIVTHVQNISETQHNNNVTNAKSRSRSQSNAVVVEETQDEVLHFGDVGCDEEYSTNSDSPRVLRNRKRNRSDAETYTHEGSDDHSSSDANNYKKYSNIVPNSTNLESDTILGTQKATRANKRFNTNTITKNLTIDAEPDFNYSPDTNTMDINSSMPYGTNKSTTPSSTSNKKTTGVSPKLTARPIINNIVTVQKTKRKFKNEEEYIPTGKTDENWRDFIGQESTGSRISTAKQREETTFTSDHGTSPIRRNIHDTSATTQKPPSPSIKVNYALLRNHLHEMDDEDDEMDFGPAKVINDMNLTTEELVSFIEDVEEIDDLNGPPVYVEPEPKDVMMSQNDRLRAWMEEVRRKRALLPRREVRDFNKLDDMYKVRMPKPFNKEEHRALVRTIIRMWSAKENRKL
jgi:hypothetical protein